MNKNIIDNPGYYGPTPVRHGWPVIVRASQVTRSSWQQLWGVVYNGSDGRLQEPYPFTKL